VYATALFHPGRLTWFDRSGNALSLLAPDGEYSDFRLSPDGRRLAATLVDPKTSNPTIWLFDLARGGTTRFTLGREFNAAPVWSPDGARLIFRTTRRGVVEFYRKSASLGGNEEPVLTAEMQREVSPSVAAMLTDWSSDGRSLIYSTPGTSESQLWILPDPGSSQGHTKSMEFLSSAANVMRANFSPNGHLVAYSSSESGTYQVYVQTVPLSDRKWPVSTTGGYEPRWRSDGREIYYLSQDRKLMAVPVEAGPSFGVPKALFQTKVYAGVSAFRAHYVPAPDGQRFLINTQIGDSAPNPITVVLNRAAGLKK
jgi:Tol biopolymer transport system component